MDPKSGRPSSGLMVVILALALVLAISGYEFGLVISTERENSNLSSELSSYNVGAQGQTALTKVVFAFNGHVSHLDARSANETTDDYTPNATMVWEGNTQGLGGIYTGTKNIDFTYETFLGPTTSLNFSIQSENAVLYPNGSATLMANLTFTGVSHILGKFQGQMSSTFTYTERGGTWLISSEDSDFGYFTTQYSLGV